MTYASFITRVRTRTVALRDKFSGWEIDGPLFTLVNDAVRELSAKTKDYRSSATLALVAGTSDYTVSTAIASDVGEIFLIDTGDRQIYPRDLDTLTEEKHWLSTEEGDVAPADPEYFAVISNGSTLRVVPTPVTSANVTVYYSVKVSALTFSTTNLALTIPLHDEYLDALLYLTMALMYEQLLELNVAGTMRSLAMQRLDEGKAFRPDYDSGRQVDYHNPLE